MKRMALTMVVLALMLAAGQAKADIIINFDTITTGAAVDGYYNGGTDSLGEKGPNLGVGFLAGDWLTASGFGETSQPNLAYSNSGLGSVNVAAGFSHQLSFTYGGFTTTTMDIWDAVNGTGNLLKSVELFANNPFAFSPASINFSGTARSITIVGGPAQFGWDDVTFGATAVPEPASLTLLGLGVVGLGGYARRRRKALKD
jgi:hypothetical protein